MRAFFFCWPSAVINIHGRWDEEREMVAVGARRRFDDTLQTLA